MGGMKSKPAFDKALKDSIYNDFLHFLFFGLFNLNNDLPNYDELFSEFETAIWLKTTELYSPFNMIEKNYNLVFGKYLKSENLKEKLYINAIKIKNPKIVGFKKKLVS